jgi:cytochrome c oxidase assembly factor CtaG
VSPHQLLFETWTWRPEIALVAGVALGLHVVRFRLAHPARTAALVGAIAVAGIALMSPIAALARGTLFSAHMLQHMLLALVVPPLVLLAVPPAEGAAGGVERHGVPPPLRWPVALPWVAGVGAMWIWHTPWLCNAAATRDGVRALQSASLLAMGAAFWWPIVGPLRAHRLPELVAVVYLAAACAACTVLGVTIAFSPVEVCSAYGHALDPLGALPLVRRWGLTASVDQQLGGLLMWVPGCTVYAGAILALIARFYRVPHEGLGGTPQRVGHHETIPEEASS